MSKPHDDTKPTRSKYWGYREGWMTQLNWNNQHCPDIPTSRLCKNVSHVKTYQHSLNQLYINNKVRRKWKRGFGGNVLLAKRVTDN